jgi:hypothetical protein
MHARVLETRPECAIRIAVISAEWAGLEGSLTHLFELAMSEMTATGADTVSRKPHKSAQAALHAIDSLAARLAVIWAAVEQYIVGTEMEKLWVDQLSVQIRRRAGQRNTVVHGIWCTTDVYPSDVLLTDPTAKRFTRYTAKDFDNIIDQILQTHNEVNEFTMNLWFQAALGKSLLSRPPSESGPPGQ